MKTVGIALLGYGTVGKSFEKLFMEQKAEVLKKLSHFGEDKIDLQLRWIFHREGRILEHKSSAKLTSSYEDILVDPEVDIVVELLGGKEPATHMMTKAMEKGKSVVTANKLALFEARGGLENNAKEKGVGFLYEASVAAAIPVLSILRESLLFDEVESIEGIINGSTNFILTKLTQGMSYEQAIDYAKELGYLEADPTLDLDGYDAMYKLGILCYTAYGEYPKEILRQGIQELWLPKENNRLKLIARATKDHAQVKLEEVGTESPFYTVEDGQNALRIETRYGGTYFFQGAGAGGEETATAVLADVVRLAQKIKKS